LQKDVKALFSNAKPNSSKGNSDEELVFVEVVTNGENVEEAGLLYQIHDNGNNVTETSISFVITYEDGIYYVQVGGVGKTTSCTTKDCASTGGCQPTYDSKCTPCNNGGECTRTTTNVISSVIEAVIGSLN